MRRFIALAVLAAAIPFAGCLKSKDHVTLNKDGSGTIVSTYAVDMTKARELAAAASMLMGQGSPEEIAKMKDIELLNFEHPNWFKAAAAKTEGYSITSATQQIASKEEGKKDAGTTRTTRVEATFTSLAAAAQADAFAITSVTLSKVEKTEKLPKGAWKLVVKDAFSGLDPSQTGGMDPTQMLPMFEGQLKKGLAITLAFTVPGTILSTNGTKADDGRTATMEITYDKVLEGKGLGLTIVFETADDIKLKPFASAPDVMRLAQRLMGKPPALKAAAKKDEGGGAEAGGETPEGKDAEGKDGDAKKADGEMKPEAKKPDAPKKPEAPKKAEAAK